MSSDFGKSRLIRNILEPGLKSFYFSGGVRDETVKTQFDENRDVPTDFSGVILWETDCFPVIKFLLTNDINEYLQKYF